MKKKLSALLFLMSSQTFAACFFSLSANSINYTVSETNSGAVEYEVALNRGNSNDSKCDTFLIGFSEGGAANYNRLATNALNGITLPYNLYKTNNTTTMLRRIEDSSSYSEVLNGTVARNGSGNVSYFFKLGSLSNSSLTRGGLYKDTITLNVDSGDFNLLADEASTTLQVNINVPKIASLSLVNSGGAFDASSTNKTLDFGELSENQDLSFDVIVLSNAGYNLSVSSLNRQVMQLQGATPGSSNQIGYLFYANSSLKNISSSSPVSIVSGSGVTPVSGTRVPVKVVIQSVAGKDPGIYQDYLTFTIATTE